MIENAKRHSSKRMNVKILFQRNQRIRRHLPGQAPVSSRPQMYDQVERRIAHHIEGPVWHERITVGGVFPVNLAVGAAQDGEGGGSDVRGYSVREDSAGGEDNVSLG